ncbi:MAG: Uncharacterized protein G01um101425_480 [Candidatus Peregrinibacteria bacterium Gr01-1014_25]|nr:MAG: Uncharacterized protein G01um101425_480 [Candidatus Peregrinibacteria bacterium Gr01-1014_25]
MMPLAKHIVDQTLATPHGEAAYKVVEQLTDAGHDTWWVGGCVRDMLLGIVPADIDIGTAALPEEIARVFPDAREVTAGLGSVLVHYRAVDIEVTTFREDDETSDGRHPESVVFGTREQDARRRDFTVNALYYNPINRELYDPFGGERDLQERLVRFIGDGAVRIKHDVLRMLRAVRLRAVLDGQYHPETYRALQELAHLLPSLSGTRQLEELEKMLAGPRPARALEDLWELRILHEMLPELAVCKGVPQPKDYHHEGDVWEHLLKCASAFASDDGPDIRLAALFHDCGKAQTFSQAERIRFDHHAEVSASLVSAALDRLRCPARRRDKIAWLIGHHMMMGAFTDMPETRKGHWYYHPWFPELLRLFQLDIAGTDPPVYDLYDEIVRDYHAFLDSHPRPEKALLSGADVMEILGIRPGEEVGRVLQQLHGEQVERRITTKKEARSFVERMKEEGR